MPTGVPVQIIAPGPVSTAVFNVDVVMQEEHDFDSKITDFPVEDGTDISDNIVNLPIMISMRGIVSNAPVIVANANSGRLLEQGIDAGDIPVENTLFTGEDYVTDALNNLLAIRDARQLVTLITGLQRYSNMVLHKINIRRDEKTNNILDFSSRWREFIIVGSQTVVFPNLRAGKAKDQGGIVDAGKQTTTAANDPGSTMAFKLVNAFRTTPLKGGVP